MQLLDWLKSRIISRLACDLKLIVNDHSQLV